MDVVNVCDVCNICNVLVLCIVDDSRFARRWGEFSLLFQWLIGVNFLFEALIRLILLKIIGCGCDASQIGILLWQILGLIID